MRAAYGESISYSMTALVSYLRTHPDPERVVVVLGDHQPSLEVTGDNPSHDVPITVLSQDPAVMSRTATWGWQDGLRPAPTPRCGAWTSSATASWPPTPRRTGQPPAAGRPRRADAARR